MWKFALAFCGFDIVAWGLVSWTPSYLIDVKHVDVGATGILASIPFFVATVSTVLGGLVFDRLVHDKPRMLIVPAMVVTGVMLWVMIHATSVGQFILFESFGTAAMYLTFMPIFGLPLRVLPQQMAGAASSMVNFGGQIAGALTPFIMGALADAFSFTVAFGFLLVGVALAIISAIVSPQTREAFTRAMRLDTGAPQPTSSGR